MGETLRTWDTDGFSQKNFIPHSERNQQGEASESPQLFDFGAGLNMTRTDLLLIPELEIVVDGAEPIGAVYDPVLERTVQLYRVGDGVVRVKAQTGIEG